MTLEESQEPMPWVEHVAPVAPDILALQVRAGRVQPMQQMPYAPRPDDRIERTRARVSGEVHQVLLIRDGEPVGYLVGPKRDTLTTLERLVGEPLDEEAADRPQSYRIFSPDDPAYAEGAAPDRLWRKSKAINWTQPGKGAAMRHHLYLKLPQPPQEGARYTVEPTGLNLDVDQVEYVHRPERVRSEAVHASHVGFRPDDPGKCAFLSVWLGTGGAYSYAEGLRFRLLDDATGETAYEGEVRLSRAADEPEQMKRRANYNLTDVYRMEFVEFDRPGRYRVCVEGVGCSYPFEIAGQAWERAFRVSMKGHYHHRSGIALGPPHTDYVRPRCFHPDDGVTVYHSECPLMYSGNGLNALGTDSGNFANLIAGRTDQIVPDAWGAYMDAGDWDRRIQHLDASRLQLELVEMFPDYFAGVGLNIPESQNALPDTVNEALFNIDGYRRLQAGHGGVRGGIESSGHPVSGECSWQESQTIMSYKPGLWSSHVYAGLAARAAHVLRRFDAGLAGLYRQSALRAMEWAEAELADWPNRPEYEQVRDGAKQRIRDDRCLAAVELYRLTGQERWHAIFRQTTRLGEGPDLSERQRDAAFLYARLGDEAVDAGLKQAAVEFTVADAERGVEFARGNAWALTTRYYDRPPQHGFYGMADAMQVVRGHALTGREDFLRAIVESAVFSAGGNPMNMAMTSGVGHDWPRNVLHVDSRHSGQPVPAGITLYGAADYVFYKGSRYWNWPFEVGLDEQCTPPASRWPIVEGYFDVYSWAAVCEYTIMQTLGPNSYVWGYLAARR